MEFLGGRLPGFDFKLIDRDETLDDFELVDQDQEERYFDAEDGAGEEADQASNTGIQDF